MHTTEDIRREFRRLDAITGADTEGIEIEISKRMVKRLGCFRHPRNPESGVPPRVSVSALLLSEEDLFWDTVRHEYAHAVLWLRHPGEDHGHDALWKALCRQIGCTPKSTAALTSEQRAARESRAKYLVRCEGCGRESRYLRRGKVIDLLLQGRGNRIRCAQCGGNRFKLWERE